MKYFCSKTHDFYYLTHYHLLCRLRGNAFIGYNDIERESYYKWDYGTSKYENFCNYEPNNINGIEDCVVLRIEQNGCWNDVPCDARGTSHFICEFE